MPAPKNRRIGWQAGRGGAMGGLMGGLMVGGGGGQNDPEGSGTELWRRYCRQLEGDPLLLSDRHCAPPPSNGLSALPPVCKWEG